VSSGTSGLNRQELGTWVRYISASRSLFQALDRRLRDESGLSLTDFELLAAIQRSRDVRMRDLAELVSFSPSRLTHVVRRMAARGWVDVSATPGDKRSKTLRLTRAGKGVLDDAWPAHARAIRDLFLDQLAEQDREAFEDTFRRIRQATKASSDSLDGSTTSGAS